jgi:hypothetical protein
LDVWYSSVWDVGRQMTSNKWRVYQKEKTTVFDAKHKGLAQRAWALFGAGLNRLKEISRNIHPGTYCGCSNTEMLDVDEDFAII